MHLATYNYYDNITILLECYDIIKLTYEDILLQFCGYISNRIFM